MSDAPVTSRPTRLAWLCPPLALWLLWREYRPYRIGKSILLLLLLLVQLVVGLFAMGKLGWVRVDWDGRGRPGALR